MKDQPEQLREMGHVGAFRHRDLFGDHTSSGDHKLENQIANHLGANRPVYQDKGLILNSAIVHLDESHQVSWCPCPRHCVDALSSPEGD